MPSDIMKKVVEAEKGCDEKKAKARDEANAIIAEAEKKAVSMIKEAEAFARAKSKMIIDKAQSGAQEKISGGSSETLSEIASLKAAAGEKQADASRQIALYLLQLS
ncbi:MAG: hypothetical protein J1E34_00050 [Oscillospiraceae bacterium]|nr:hypothetical protein [Oscillospiraceae bacterium]